jgi:tetratricopeptide (TPR) repeat protein
LLELALQDLQKYGQDLEPEFEANCNFLKGFIAYNKKQLDIAINYYQQSLDFWQTTDNLEIPGKILYNLTICNYEKLRPNPPTPFPTREGGEIINCIQQILEKFKNAQRLDLIANSLSKFGLILQDLQAWEQLKTLSQQALEIHQAENNILKIAEDYLFLATANFEQSNFQEAAKIANQGIGVIHELSLLNYYRQSLFLILAQAQEKLQQHEQAISNLKLAKDIGVINNHPKLYVKILNLLQKLLFQKTEYLEAFNTKLESRSIEQQFGLRAFIGAGWLKPAKNTNLNVSYIWKNNLDLDLNETFDLTFIDTWHVYGQLIRELNKFSKITNKYIILHDTTVDGVYGETIRKKMNAEKQSKESGFPLNEINKGLEFAVNDFLKENSNWSIKEKFTNNNGLTILEKN